MRLSKRNSFFCFLLILVLWFLLDITDFLFPMAPIIVISPDSSITFELTGSNRCLAYSIKAGKDYITSSSNLYFSALDHDPRLICGLKIISVEENTVDNQWKPVFGQRSVVRNRYSEAKVILGRGVYELRPALRIDIRVFEEGVGFRMVLLDAANSGLIPKWVHPGEEVPLLFRASLNLDVGIEGTIYRDLSCERGFQVHHLSEKVDAGGWLYSRPMNPFTVKYDNGVLFAFTEASNSDFEPIRFTAEGSYQSLTATFKRYDVIQATDLFSPWFTFIIGRTPGELIEFSDDLIYNLNEPCAIPDPSWIRVGKVFRDFSLSTSSSMAAIDLAKSIGTQYLLLDAGWYGPEGNVSSDPTKWLQRPKEGSFDLMQILAYGKSKGIGVFLYVNDIALKRHLDEILPLYQLWGVAGIKFGFVNVWSSKDTARLMAYVRKCAEYKLLVNIHDCFRPSGYSRTYPNLVSIEGIRGDEHTEGPQHGMMLPFVRFLGGFADHTFVFDEKRIAEMNKTLTHQIALAIIYHNPVQHIYWYHDPWSLIELFSSLPATLKHLEVWRDMSTTWEETKVITSSIGEFIVMARKDVMGNWFLASATKTARILSYPIDFLDHSRSYTTERYQDNPKTPASGGIFTSYQTPGSVTSIHTARLLDGGGEILVFKQGSPINDREK